MYLEPSVSNNGIAVLLQVRFRNTARGDQLVVLFVDHFYFAVDNHQFKHRDAIIGHELSGNCSAHQIRKLLRATRDVLLRLHHAVSVTAAFRLHGNHKLATMPVDADVNLVNFYLTDPRHGGA